ncbi:MAG: serine/threonine-protein phosphatase [Bacteroidales bacterium]|nr:serine/threonine-protein phosphatase [Bacteroidales bacterium]
MLKNKITITLFLLLFFSTRGYTIESDSSKTSYENQIKAYRHQAYEYTRNNDFVHAAKNLYKWQQLTEKQKDTTRMIECYIFLGTHYQFKNIPDSSFYYNNKALKLSILRHDTTAMSDCYACIGAETFNRVFYSLSEDYLKKALHLDSLIENEEKMALSLSLLGLVYGIQYIDNPKNETFKNKALDCVKKSLSLKGNIFSLYNSYYAMTQHSMWYKQDDSCKYYYQKFKEMSNYVPYKTMTVSLDVDYLIYQKQYRKALSYLESQKKIFENSKINMRFYYEKLNYVYERLGDYRNAHEANVKQFQYQREISNDNTTRAIANAEAEKAAAVERIKLEESEKFFEEQKKHFNTIVIALLTGLLLVSAVVLLFFRLWKLKQNSNEQLIQKNLLLDKQKEEIENFNNQLISSINYAERIQRAAVSSEEDVKTLFPNSFVLYLPRDIVSGDYYRAVQCGKYSVMITADCTGHGIPGAFLSMLGISSINSFITKESDAENPGTILDRMRNFIKQTLVSKNTEEIGDGMDMTICCFDTENMELKYAVANQRIILIRDGVAKRLKGDNMPVGRYLREREHFETFSMKLQKGDIIYMFSDGIEDQLGGDDSDGLGHKYLIRTLENFLLKNSSEPLENQKQLLITEITSWRGNIPQIDDITMVGIKV